MSLYVITYGRDILPEIAAKYDLPHDYLAEGRVIVEASSIADARRTFHGHYDTEGVIVRSIAACAWPVHLTGWELPVHEARPVAPLRRRLEVVR